MKLNQDKIRTSSLDWSEFDNGTSQADSTVTDIISFLGEIPDFILISDCIFQEVYGNSYISLAKVLEIIVKKKNKSCTVINAVERRNNKENSDGVPEFIKKLSSVGFKTTKVENICLQTNEIEIYLHTWNKVV